MSIPPHYTTTRTEAVEDCRDYLRTGRCKYGASCKYNHPPNVQSGGGMKVPLDPSEPMFPIRPGEPVCQYYMKHGTCKFGQACKFHHPPQATQHGVNGGHVVMMNVGRPDSQRLLVNPSAMDAGNSSVMVQFLPQRPDEPDCIYFLKNGRCKYGPTCRYHHPLNYHQRRAEEQRRHHEQRRSQMAHQGAQVQYVSQQVVGFPQGHVLVSDQPVSYVNMADNNQGHQPLTAMPGATEGSFSYYVPIGSTVGTEQGSSASSIASSFDTSGSNLETLALAHGEGLWRRRNESGGSLSTYGDGRNQSRVILPHSASDGNIARRSRASSYGSAGEHAAYYDSNFPHLHRIVSTGSWRADSSHSMPQSQYAQRPESTDGSSPEKRSPNVRPRPTPTGSVRRSARMSARAREGDEAFTMMTSALLNMLDTPEEALTESCSDDEAQKPHTSYYNNNNETDSSIFERLSLNPNAVNQDEMYGRGGAPPSWSQPGSSSHKPVNSDAQRIQMMQSRQQQGHPPSNHDSDVGLYLP